MKLLASFILRLDTKSKIITEKYDKVTTYHSFIFEFKISCGQISTKILYLFFVYLKEESDHEILFKVYIIFNTQVHFL